MTLAHLDIDNRRPVWKALSDLFLDTELEDSDLIRIARTLAESAYSLEEAETILYCEVYPVCIGNLLCVAGEWDGFDDDWLAKSILKHTARSWAFGNFLQPWRWMVRGHWNRIKALIPIFADNAALQPLAAALVAERSIVVLDVPWSIYARRAVALLESSAGQLELLGIIIAKVDEESPHVQGWLKCVSPHEFEFGIPHGAGSLFWLEHGSVVDMMLSGGGLTRDEFAARTRDRWDATPTTAILGMLCITLPQDFLRVLFEFPP